MSPQARREAVDAMRAKTGISERRACQLIGLSRTVLRYRPCEDQVNVGLCTRITALAAERRRFGYRRIHVLLRREGQAFNVKRVHNATDGPRHQYDESVESAGCEEDRRRSCEGEGTRDRPLRSQASSLATPHTMAPPARGARLRALFAVVVVLVALELMPYQLSKRSSVFAVNYTVTV